MEIVIEILIYIVAIFGIIITCISFYEMYDFKKYINNTYRIFSKKSSGEKNIEVIIKMEGIEEEEEKAIINKINSDDIVKEIANTIVIQKND